MLIRHKVQFGISYFVRRIYYASESYTQKNQFFTQKEGHFSGFSSLFCLIFPLTYLFTLLVILPPNHSILQNIYPRLVMDRILSWLPTRYQVGYRLLSRLPTEYSSEYQVGWTGYQVGYLPDIKLATYQISSWLHTRYQVDHTGH